MRASRDWIRKLSVHAKEKHVRFGKICFRSDVRMTRKPRIVVFDLDYTLWPFYVDCSVTPPFRKNRCGEIVDSHFKLVECYKDVPSVLSELYSTGIQICVASRTGEIDGAQQLINLFGWDQFFTVKEIYPGSKIEHFNSIHEKTAVPYKDMIFFDDERRNITDVRSLGVTCIHVENGVTRKVVEEGLKRFYGY